MSRRLPRPGRHPARSVDREARHASRAGANGPGFTPPYPGRYPMELSRNIRVDSVSRLDPAPPRAIADDAPVAEAVAVMRREKTGCLLVTSGGRLVGVFT